MIVWLHSIQSRDPVYYVIYRTIATTGSINVISVLFIIYVPIQKFNTYIV